MTDYQLVLLHAKWCGYCKRFNPSDKASGDRLTWKDVKEKVKDKMKCAEFEEGDLEKDHDGYDMDSIKESIQGWPTLIFLVKEDGKYKPHSYFEGSRDKIEDFHTEIERVLKSDKKAILSGGGIPTVNRYRAKYKKYKQLYADLLTKYKQLKN